MNSFQLKTLIIEPTLKIIKLYTLSGVNILLGTAAVESDLGEYIEQVPNGQAKSIYQIEMKTHDDTVNQIKIKCPSLYSKINDLKIKCLTDEENLIGNLYYATAIARLVYFLIKKRLPPHNDILALANYWKKYYNTEAGKGRVEDFVGKYASLVKIL